MNIPTGILMSKSTGYCQAAIHDRKIPRPPPPAPSYCPRRRRSFIYSPVVVFGAKLEVAEHHGDVCASHDQDDEHQHQETENVIVATHPQGLQDEEHLNENCSVGEDAAHGDGEATPQEPRLVGDLSKTQREDGTRQPPSARQEPKHRSPKSGQKEAESSKNEMLQHRNNHLC